jgi:hypothetical protein
MDYEREQEELAAEEARHIGGDPDADDEDYVQLDSRPAGISEEAYRPLEEAGEGESEGFEEAEAELVERAENPHGPSPIRDAEGIEEDPEALDIEYGEGDEEHTAEDDPDESDR